MKLTSAQKYRLLLKISHNLRDTLDADAIMAHILETLQTVVDYDAAGIFVLNQPFAHSWGNAPGNMIAGVCWRGYDPQPTGSDEMLRDGKGITGYVIKTGKSLIVPDVSQDQHYVEARPETRAEIAVPILRSKSTIGALNLESDKLNAFDENDLEVLRFFADAAAIALEKAMLHQQILEKKLLEKQLELAREVQERLLPQEAPHLPGYDIAAICIPASQIGGDYFDFLPTPQGELGLAVADVSGHGIASALAMTAFRGLLRMQTRREKTLSEMAQSINQLLPDFIGDSHFITMSYGCLNPQKDDIRFVSCGHPSPVFLHPDDTWETLKENGPAFGVFDQAAYVDERIPLKKGDLMMIYTDGVVEIEDRNGKAFQVDQLVNILIKHRQLPAKMLIKQVIKETQAFTGYQTTSDDFTLIVVKKK